MSASVNLPNSPVKEPGRGRSVTDDQKVDFPLPARSPSPLTEAKLERLPKYSRRKPPTGSSENPDGRFTFSHLGDLQSTEHDVIATRKSKVQIVNLAVEKLNHFPDNKPVTVISVGAGHLMPEQLIHLQSSESRKADTKWRCIDPIYVKSGTDADRFEIGRQARLSFGKDKAEAKAFTSSTAYLCKTENGARLLDQDKKGSILILEIDPPTILPDQWSKVSQDMQQNGFLIRGKPLAKEDVKKANVVLLTFAQNDQGGRAMLDGASAGLARTGMAFGTTTMKCYADKNGNYKFKAGGAIPKSLCDLVKSRVDFHSSKLDKEKSSIEKLNHSINECVKEIDHANKATIAKSTLFSDVDRSVEELIENFSDAKGSVVFAKLENSQTEVRVIK